MVDVLLLLISVFTCYPAQNCLPQGSVTVSILLLCYIFPQIYLGNFPAKRFTEEVPQDLISRFQRQLEGITGDIEERNKKLDVPYTYMLPTKIPNSITI